MRNNGSQPFMPYLERAKLSAESLFPSADTCSVLSAKAVPTTRKECCCDHCHICTKTPSENLYVNVFMQIFFNKLTTKLV